MLTYLIGPLVCLAGISLARSVEHETSWHVELIRVAEQWRALAWLIGVFILIFMTPDLVFNQIMPITHRLIDITTLGDLSITTIGVFLLLPGFIALPLAAYKGVGSLLMCHMLWAEALRVNAISPLAFMMAIIIGAPLASLPWMAGIGESLVICLVAVIQYRAYCDLFYDQGSGLRRRAPRLAGAQ